MKLILFLPFLIFPAACSSSGGPGTLGASATRELECSSSNVQHEILVLQELKSFEVSGKDSVAVNWWKEGGYDFLNYECLVIKKRLYMITINSEDVESATISIRSFYDCNKKKWIFATEFSSSDNYRAEKATDYLVNSISGCK